MAATDIGNNTRRHMKIRGFTVPALAKKSGIGTATLSNILNGKSEPKSSTLIGIAAALSVPVVELVADSPVLKSLRFRTAKTLSGREKAEREQLKHDTALWLANYSFLRGNWACIRNSASVKSAERTQSRRQSPSGKRWTFGHRQLLISRN